MKTGIKRERGLEGIRIHIRKLKGETGGASGGVSACSRADALYTLASQYMSSDEKVSDDEEAQIGNGTGSDRKPTIIQ